MKKTPLQRKTRLLSGPSVKLTRGPLAKVNPKRKAENFDRAYGGAERVGWIQAQSCVACSGRPCENAHVKNGGAGRKADARWIVPLCLLCHQDYHQNGQKSFEAAHQIDLFALATIIDARWEQYQASHHPTSEHTP